MTNRIGKGVREPGRVVKANGLERFPTGLRVDESIAREFKPFRHVGSEAIGHPVGINRAHRGKGEHEDERRADGQDGGSRFRRTARDARTPPGHGLRRA